jgi:NitT/TauT family transport system substrate-binding protein
MIVNPQLAAAKPEAVKGFVRAAIVGTHIAIKDPARAEPKSSAAWTAARLELELERLNTVIARQHPDRRGEAPRHRRHRPGQVRTIDRSDRGGFKFQKRPTVSDIFDDSLPAAGYRPPDQLSKIQTLLVRRR